MKRTMNSVESDLINILPASTPRKSLVRQPSSRCEKTLEGVVKQINDLPTLPEVVLKTTEVVNNPLSSAKDLGNLISRDQVQTARLLKLVNSAYYGFPREITKVTTAIVILGFNSIKQLLLSTAVFDMFGKDRNANINRTKLMHHTIGTAIAARSIGKQLGYPELEELFVAGLLHDIGKVVMDRYFHQEYLTILKKTSEQEITFLDAERQLLDIDHAMLGRLLAKHWNLPIKLETIIAHHHHPIESGLFGLETAIVHLADILARAKQIGSGGDHVMPDLDPWSWETLRLNYQQLESVLSHIEEEYPQVIAIFEL
jgi:putative nucleotidyltransferase with HDIG domain